MKKEIKRIHISKLDEDQFYREYWLKEIPVIIEGVDLDKNEDLTPESISYKFLKKENKQSGWYDSEVIKEDTPKFVQNLFALKDTFTRKKPMRVFMQPNGHQTPLHYDGNSLCGLNLLKKGEKDWVLISPNTPFKSIPFMFLAMTGQIEELDESIDHYKFTTKPGDLLYIPRYWQHQVTCKSSLNINYNWVMTKETPNQTKLGKRESEVIKLRATIPWVNKVFFPDSIDEYGGVGREAIENYTKNTSVFKAICRLSIELLNFIPLIFYYKLVKGRADNFVNNNFNAKSIS